MLSAGPTCASEVSEMFSSSDPHGKSKTQTCPKLQRAKGWPLAISRRLHACTAQISPPDWPRCVGGTPMTMAPEVREGEKKAMSASAVPAPAGLGQQLWTKVRRVVRWLGPQQSMSFKAQRRTRLLAL